MVKKIFLLGILVSISIAVYGNFQPLEKPATTKYNYSDSLISHEDSLYFLINNNVLDSVEKKIFFIDFFNRSLAIFYEQKGIIAAWKTCMADDSLRKENAVLRKTALFINKNQHKSEFLKNEFQITPKSQRAAFLHRTWWADSLKSNFDTLGNSSGFKTAGIDAKEIKKGILEDMKTEASAPQFVELIINSGKSVPRKIEVNSGYVLYKIIPKGGSPPSLFTPFWTKLEELHKYATDELEQRFGLPIVSHSAKYDVYKIQLKEGKTALVFESEIAATTENNYKTTGGGIQSLVLDRTKWTFPILINELEIFPPLKK